MLIALVILVLQLAIAIDYTNPDEVNGLSYKELDKAISSGLVNPSIVEADKLIEIFDNYEYEGTGYMTLRKLSDGDIKRVFLKKPSLQGKFIKHPYYLRNKLTDFAKEDISILNDNPDFKSEFFKSYGIEIDSKAKIESISKSKYSPEVKTIGENSITFRLKDVWDGEGELIGSRIKEDGSLELKNGDKISKGSVYIADVETKYKFEDTYFMERIEEGDLVINGQIESKGNLFVSEFSRGSLLLKIRQDGDETNIFGGGQTNTPYQDIFGEGRTGLYDVRVFDSLTGDTKYSFRGGIRLDSQDRTILYEDSVFKSRFENGEYTIAYRPDEKVAIVSYGQEPSSNLANIIESEELVHINNVKSTDIIVTFNHIYDSDNDNFKNPFKGKIIVSSDENERGLDNPGTVTISNGLQGTTGKGRNFEQGGDITIQSNGRFYGKGEYYTLPPVESRFYGNDEKPHRIKVTSTSDSSCSLSLCSDCKIVGNGYQRLGKQLEKDMSEVLSSEKTLPSTTTIIDAHIERRSNRKYYIDGEENIYVVDKVNNAVYHRDKDGNYRLITPDNKKGLEFKDTQYIISTERDIKAIQKSRFKGYEPPETLDALAPDTNILIRLWQKWRDLDLSAY